MDTITLVDELIDDGRKLIDRLIKEKIPVLMACWVKPVEDDRWSLYIATPLVNEKGAGPAYREVYRVLRSLGNMWVTDSDISLVGRDDPITKDVLDIKRRFPGRMPTRSRRPQLGNLAVEETYVYPETQSEGKSARRAFTVEYFRKNNTNEWKSRTTREDVVRTNSLFEKRAGLRMEIEDDERGCRQGRRSQGSRPLFDVPLGRGLGRGVVG